MLYAALSTCILQAFACRMQGGSVLDEMHIRMIKSS